MEDYAGRILAERYRLPLPPSDAYELIETRAFDTRSGQEVLVRQIPLPEVVDAELLDGSRGAPPIAGGRRLPHGELPAVRRAIEAAQAAASVPDHPRLDQVFDVFAEGGSLWIVSELVPARPLAALIADEPLSPYRAAEVAADVLTALRVLHAHGWTHRNITMRTVLICEDGRVVLTGLAAGAAEDALCGYDPVPPQDGTDPSALPWPGGEPAPWPGGAPGLAEGRPESGGGYADGYGRAALAGPGADTVYGGAAPAGPGTGAGYGGGSQGGSWGGTAADAGYGQGFGQESGPGAGAVGGQRGGEPGERYDDLYGDGGGDGYGRGGRSAPARAAGGGGAAPPPPPDPAFP
ncbi:protein kinase, partial [Streptomyces sp. NPDC058401]|uniref:protein kinase n=1 Tax=Streptomyces sp. NPDC058401 TaxID=3346480 RepID=UPI0036617436